MGKLQNHIGEFNIPKLPGWLSFPEAAAQLGMTKQGFHKTVFNRPGLFETVHVVGDAMYVVKEEEVQAYIKHREQVATFRQGMRDEKAADLKASGYVSEDTMDT